MRTHVRRKMWTATLLLFVCPAALKAQQLGQGEGGSNISPSQIFLLAGFLGCLVVAAALIIRFKGQPIRIWSKPRERELLVLETVRLHTRTSLCRVQWRNTQYLIAVADGRAELIDTCAMTSVEPSL